MLHFGFMPSSLRVFKKGSHLYVSMFFYRDPSGSIWGIHGRMEILKSEARIFVIAHVRAALGWMGRTNAGSVHWHGEPGGRTGVRM